jgi:hypothetical protein
MAEHDPRDEEVSRRYRELDAEEPPPALDAAIRAHARRAVEARSTRPWYFSLAAAAVLVLAVALTWNVEREAPDMVAVTSAPPAAPVEKAEEKAEAPAAPAPQPARRRAVKPKVEDSAGERELAKQQAPAAEMRADQAQPRPPQSQPQLGAAARSEVMRQQAFAETPEQWLERIAKLRAEGKHDEADKALAEFRKRYPDFRISEETLKKVER